MINLQYSNEELLTMYQNGDSSAFDMLIEQNTALVHSIVKHFTGRGHEQEDLFQIGVIGLIKAVKNFNLQFGVKFSTYAVPLITGEIKRFLRDDSIIKISRSTKELGMKAGVQSLKLRQELGREPTISEIAAAVGVDTETLIPALEAIQPPQSLDDHTASDSSGRPLTLMDTVADEESEEKIINSMLLKQLMSTLDKRSYALVHMRYLEGKTQSDVASAFGISQVQVSRLEKKILLNLREQALK